MDREKCFEAEGQVGEQLCGDEEERREEKIRDFFLNETAYQKETLCYLQQGHLGPTLLLWLSFLLLVSFHFQILLLYFTLLFFLFPSRDFEEGILQQARKICTDFLKKEVWFQSNQSRRKARLSSRSRMLYTTSRNHEK